MCLLERCNLFSLAETKLPLCSWILDLTFKHFTLGFVLFSMLSIIPVELPTKWKIWHVLQKKSETLILFDCTWFDCIFISSSGKLNVVTPSGKTAAMNKCACFKMALFLATYNEFFIKNVSVHYFLILFVQKLPSTIVFSLQKPSQYLAQVIGSDVLSRRLGTPCVRLLLCFVDSDHMVKGSSADDPLFRLFVPFSGETEGRLFIVLL